MQGALPYLFSGGCTGVAVCCAVETYCQEDLLRSLTQKPATTQDEDRLKQAVNQVQSHAQLNAQLARSPEELSAWEAIDRDQLWPGDPGFSAAASAAGAHHPESIPPMITSHTNGLSVRMMLR